MHEISWNARFVLASSPSLPTSIRPNFRPDGSHTLDKKKIYLLALILMLTIYWLLSFFGQSIVHGISHTSGFIDMLSVIIVALIIIRFLS